MVCVSSSGVQGVPFYQNKRKTATRKEYEEYWSPLLGLLSKSLTLYGESLAFFGVGDLQYLHFLWCILQLICIAFSLSPHSDPCLSASPLPVIALCCYSMTELFNTSLVHVKLYGQIVKLKAQFCHKLSFSTAGQ